jgi:hypothetical protein
MEMAGIKPIAARITFKMDTGEMDGEKKIYRAASVSRVRGSAGAAELGAVAGKLKELLAYPTEVITLNRSDEIEL